MTHQYDDVASTNPPSVSQSDIADEDSNQPYTFDQESFNNAALRLQQQEQQNEQQQMMQHQKQSMFCCVTGIKRVGQGKRGQRD